MNTLKPWEALLCVLAALTGLIAMGPLLVDHLGLLGITLSELGFVALPTVGFLQSRGLPPVASLGLSRARLSGVAGGILCGAGEFWLVALLEATVLERLLPVPEAVKESLRRLVVPGAGARLLILDVLALALTPALCEEALFRGLALPSLRPRLGTAGAVAVTALLFAGFHLSIYRFVPTALLGALLGALRAASGSLWPAIFAHAANNLLVLVLVRAGLDAPPLPGSVSGLAGLLAAVASLTVGLALVRRSPQPA